VAAKVRRSCIMSKTIWHQKIWVRKDWLQCWMPWKS